MRTKGWEELLTGGKAIEQKLGQERKAAGFLLMSVLLVTSMPKAMLIGLGKIPV